MEKRRRLGIQSLVLAVEPHLARLGDFEANEAERIARKDVLAPGARVVAVYERGQFSSWKFEPGAMLEEAPDLVDGAATLTEGQGEGRSAAKLLSIT